MKSALLFRTSLAALAALIATGATAQTKNPAEQAVLLGQFGDWGAYRATPDGKKVCFALSKPTSATTEPAGRNRDPGYAFVSTRPAEKVKNEVSVIVGYPQKPGHDASATIDRRTTCSTRRMTAPGSRMPPRRRAWWTPCARAPIWWSRLGSWNTRFRFRSAEACGSASGASPGDNVGFLSHFG